MLVPARAGSSLGRSEPGEEEADIRLDSTGVDLVSGGVSVDMQEGPKAAIKWYPVFAR